MPRRFLLHSCIAVLILGILSGCGRMLPMGGRDDLIKYTVRKGETLYSISWRYGYDHREVAAWNGISAPYSIYPGQRLLLIPPHQRHARKPYYKNLDKGSTTTATRSSTKTGTKPAVTAASSQRPKPLASNPSMVEKAPPKHKQKRVAWKWPTLGLIVNRYNPAKGKKGLDIRGKLGQRVNAAADGKVVYSGSGLIGYGNLIIIKHNDTYLSAYGHNRRLLVKEGTAVKQGQKIAEMGDSPKEGIILHFEIRRDGKPVNPLAYLPKRRS